MQVDLQTGSIAGQGGTRRTYAWLRAR